ncbi:uncharacterized protein Fot_41200 [Forsythia ovata]|uniref:Uncharacterized protein n=1 Tax=Forsythia ovata TaxID=205694 RepID=A0ABD1RHK1_9LAMI
MSVFDETEEDKFFDSRDEITYVSNLGSEYWHTAEKDEEEGLCSDEVKYGFDRLTDNGETVLANLESEQQLSSSCSSYSFQSNEAMEFIEGGPMENFMWKIKNLDD